MKPSLRSRKRLNLNAELKLNSRPLAASGTATYDAMLARQNKTWTKTWLKQQQSLQSPANQASFFNELSADAYRWWEN
jgi:hypothetical protein